MPPTDYKQVSMRKDVYAVAQALALREDRSVASVVRRAVLAYVLALREEDAAAR